MKYYRPSEYAAGIEALVARAARYNEIIGLHSDAGDAVLMSQEEYDALMETVHIMRSPEAARAVLEAAEEELEACVAEEDVSW